MTDLHATVGEVTERIKRRSAASRADYLRRVEAAADARPLRHRLSCGNLAHGFAACGSEEKARLRGELSPNIAIVSAYNDMLSAHQPLGAYPALIKEALAGTGATAQFAGGVPAMCDGVTQGQPGMQLSLFSRDVIAQATAIALSHNMFDGALCLGVCDKIVPGMLMGALSFGHLPTIFVPAGPMPTGISNKEKARIRALYAEGKVGREALLEMESAAYHSPGTCTFYGTANSNQMLMEIMGLHLPGSAFINPGTPLRDAMTVGAAQRVARITALNQDGSYTPIGRVVDERALVNAIVGLVATGGSTNHTLHLPAIARIAGIVIDWEDFSDLSRVVPLLARVYPNGGADVNQFHSAGGLAWLIRELLEAGLLHGDVTTVAGQGLDAYARIPELDGAGKLSWKTPPRQSGDAAILRPVTSPFAPDGGLVILRGNLGQAVVKVSAVEERHWVIEAPARVFHDQDDVVDAFQRDELNRDCVVVVTYQGPRAIGMPELHKLTPPLGILLDRGFQVALVTDGRMSGASGRVPAAIHVTPEAASGGPIARIRDGDLLRLDCRSGVLSVLVDEAHWRGRQPANVELTPHRS
ncbi:MAG TPA: phosphogluconate dehydratase [Gammaproteobacteria bacterium]|nr:phosphogluconate dehydratase [Gammaproteobacteria bacterium]MCH77087.1 phosphogluconate dehydratase [Gammaproteobacteria bacterium]